MDWLSGIFVFLIIWWTALFTVLPLWVRRHDGQVQGADPGAPQQPHLLRKAVTTTLVSVVIWLIIYVLIEIEIISFYAIADQMFDRDH